jgi:ligand-binding sensor domain-containing protein
MRINPGRESLTLFRLLLFCLLLSPFDSGRSEQLPFRPYRTGDRLAHDNVHSIVRDSRGFLWFGTVDGLSRFDGSGFITYGTKDGLASAYVNDLLETRSGIYLIATVLVRIANKVTRMLQ